MTSKEHIAQLRALLAKSEKNIILQAMVPAANELLATIKNRIQVDGKKTDGSQIGQYSTNPMYATIAQFDKKSSFKPQGKRESIEYATVDVKGNKKKGTIRYGTVRKPDVQKALIGGKIQAVRNVQGFNAEIRTSMYLPGGYKELRNLQGKRIDKVNQTYTGDTMLAYQQQVKDKEILQGFITEKAKLIREGQENGTSKKKGYGKIYSPTTSEMNFYKENVTKTIQLLQLDALR